jgi:hypothetical protein
MIDQNQTQPPETARSSAKVAGASMSAALSAITGNHLLIAAGLLALGIFVAVLVLGDFGTRPARRKRRRNDKRRAF